MLKKIAIRVKASSYGSYGCGKIEEKKEEVQVCLTLNTIFFLFHTGMAYHFSSYE